MLISNMQQNHLCYITDENIEWDGGDEPAFSIKAVLDFKVHNVCSDARSLKKMTASQIYGDAS